MSDHDEHPTAPDHTGHTHHGPPPAGWGVAVSATLHCLTGCAIGEVLGMVIGTALGLRRRPTVVLAIVLAFVFGYALTMRGVLRAGLAAPARCRSRWPPTPCRSPSWRSSTTRSCSPSRARWTPACDAGCSGASLAVSLAVAFVLTVPVNRWLIGRGKGHAVVHAYHH